MFALHFYAPWLGVLVPERDRIGTLEIRYDPRDISRIYVRDPGDSAFRVATHRDGVTTPLTLWEHRRDRREQRAAASRTTSEKIAITREIAAIVTAARGENPGAALFESRCREPVWRENAFSVKSIT